MPPRARARSRSSAGPVSLSEADVTALREKLEGGKKPRVMLLVNTALGPAGTTVPVVSFEEPAVGEFITVKLADDVVPFSPAELSLPTRSRAGAPKEAAPGAPAPQPPSAQPYTPSNSPGPSPRKSAGPRLVAVPEPADTPDPDRSPAAAEPKPAKAAKRPGRTGAIAVTIRFAGKGWTYESTRAGRKSAPRPLNLAAVRAFSDRIDDPSLRRDLQANIDIARAEAKTKADALRAELERVEVELAELEE
jgi:hypothetical protein